MKICKKCKTGNETSSRFCYQCGIKLQAGFPKLALPKSRGLKRSSSSFNPSQFIAHPMQDTSTIITAKNQGDLLHPKVQENVQKSIVSKAQVLKEVQGRLSKAPKSLKNSAPKLNLPELRIPDTCVESKEKLRAKMSHASI
ncbi:hypothetical protein MJH12_13840, partial [bacterium]|nr:hypothetical protein [bacterium]